MPQATIKHLYYVIGSGRSRQPRLPVPGSNPPGLGSVTCYNQQPPNTYVSGSHFTAPYPTAPAALSCIAGYKFGFQSVTGLVGGGQVSTQIGSPCSGIVGVDDIVVLNVYVPAGGGTGPNGENGAVIDAFNMETGEFCDDNFVSVAPDPNGNLTHSGNALGWVSTQASNETITAYGHISSDPIYFKKWEIVDSGVTQTNHALVVTRNSNPCAFAFYGHVIKQFHKELKETIKEFKEHKEWVMDKPDIIDTPVKRFPDFKDPKLIREGDPWGRELWDPGEKLKLQTLVDKISALETHVKTLGQSFIKTEDRPSVGKEISKGSGKAG